MTTVNQDICGCLLVVTNQSMFYIFGLALSLLVGCSYFVSWDDAVRGGVGRSIDSMIKLDGLPNAIIPLSNGNKEYKYHFKKLDPSCIHYWIVDPQGIIVDYRYEGRCRPIG